MMKPSKCFSHNQRENERCVGGNFNGLSIDFDLAPGYSFVRLGTGIRAVKLTGRVYEHGKIGSIPLFMTDLNISLIIIGNLPSNWHLQCDA